YDRPAPFLDADPGTPTFGTPGAASRVALEPDAVSERRLAGIATLDAGRFRLPLVTAIDRLVDASSGPLLLDSPGLHRGVPAGELLDGLAMATAADTAVILGAPEEHRELAAALGSTGCEIVFIEPSDAASKSTAAKRARQRTEAWDDYLEGAATRSLPLADLHVAGAHPPLDARDAWPGRQAALLDGAGRTVAMAELDGFDGGDLQCRTPAASSETIRTIVVRDARRNDEGRLRTETTAPPEETEKPLTVESPFTLRESPNRRIGSVGPLTARAGLFRATLVGGFFDDPTILVERINGDRALLFDLGEVQRYPIRVLNRVTDVFVTHAHTDHFAGFVKLLRTRVHLDRSCRLFGPPGIADRVESLVRGFTWDRLGAGEGPEFEVGELHGDTLRRWRIAAGGPTRTELDARPAPDGELFAEPRFRVRACQLDHGSPVLAFSVEESANYTVRSDRLEPPYSPGPWLGALKRKVAEGATEETVELPNGSEVRVEEVANHLLLVGEGEKLTYATDFGDTDGNRSRIIDLARDSEVFICEAFYADEDADKAADYGHLTAGACAEIARDAGVGRLIPFHFSARYDNEPERLYRQLLEVFEHVEVPEVVARRL
ncbi:MAG: MBL fold metallo-hydrolase, partial [Bradymonadaceae bacterium]